MKQHLASKKNSQGKKKAPSGEDIQNAIELLRGRNPDEMLTTEEAEDITGFTQQSFYNWIKRSVNPLAASKPGREWRIRVSDLTAFLTQREFRADDGASSVDRAGRAATPTLRLLRPLAAPQDSGVTDERGGQSQDEEINNAPRARTFIESLLKFAEVAQRWKRAVLTLQTAEASADADWIVQCEGDVVRLQTELFAACAPIGNRGLMSLRQALLDALDARNDEEVITSTSGDDNVDLFSEMSSLLTTAFTQWRKE